MTEQVTARRVALNLVRVSPRRGIGVGHLIEVGALFGFAPNAMRVALTRLSAQGLLESDGPGTYRLGAAAQGLSEYAEQWRRGEARVRPWKGAFIAVALPAKPLRRERRASLAALNRLGFADGFGGLWVRPDNLREPADATRQRLYALGLEDAAELMVVDQLGERLRSRLAGLWPVARLAREYKKRIKALQASLDRLPTLPHAESLVQTFMLGGEAIRLLATDPLLPAELMPSTARAELTELMLRYDRAGHAVWRKLPSGRAARPTVHRGSDARAN